MRLNALFRLAFAPASPHGLTSPHTVTRWLILQKARRRPLRLRLIVDQRFQVLFHSPPGVLFTFPSRYSCTIGHLRILSLTRWSSQIHTRFHGPGATRVSTEETLTFRVRGYYPLRRSFPDCFHYTSAHPISLAATLGVVVTFRSLRYLDVSVPAVPSTRTMCSYRSDTP
ncbi:unnamed protein product [Hapterophycus canaliculatus]